MRFTKYYPFSAIVGQEDLKMLLLLNAVNPKIGGVLIRGEKGTAKSTAVRALAELLPERKTIKNCPIGCDPNDELHKCPWCGKIQPDQIKICIKKPEVVTLPLNATEDRVTGSIDFSAAIKKGKRSFLPGLLASAHRSVLYVDEVNLLDDHIVDIILDAAASGENRVEREGISFNHPAQFTLVGTMNPEEGDLRPQLLDRFGLCVDVKAETDRGRRVELMERREAFDLDQKNFSERFSGKNLIISEKIALASKLMDSVVLPKFMRSFISELCIKNAVAGHRADLIMEQAAKAHAALQGRLKVSTEDITKIAPFVLMHRTRDAAPSSPENRSDTDKNQPEDNTPDKDSSPNENNTPDTKDIQNNKGNNKENSGKSPEQKGKNYDIRDGSDKIAEENSSLNGQQGQIKSSDNSSQGSSHAQDQKSLIEKIFKTGLTFKVKKIASKRDRIFRRGSGRRSRTMVSLKQGRYIKSRPGTKNTDIAIDATLRAASSHQLARTKQNGLAVVLKNEDIRVKIREKRIGNFLLFVVDASGSMGARGRMTASKGAIMSLLLDAYRKRDKVAMVSFRKNKAFVNLPPTSSVELAGKLLAEMPVGGRTPLSAALASAHQQVKNYLLRDISARPIVIIITDGKANVSMGEANPVEEALEFAGKIITDQRTSYIVVDTEETGPVHFGLAARLAGALNAGYFRIEDLKSEQLTDIVNNIDN